MNGVCIILLGSLLCESFSYFSVRRLSTVSIFSIKHNASKNKSRLEQSTKNSATVFDSIMLKGWGVFNSTRIDIPMNKSPSLVAITGETGAGKSIFLSALKYISGHTSMAKIPKLKCDDKINDKDSEVTVQMGMASSNSRLSIKRIYSSSLKKASCEVDGGKVLLRDLQRIFKDKIRFWSKDSINKLDNADFVEYIDRCIPPEQRVEQLELVTESYNLWMNEKRELDRLQILEQKASDTLEIQLLNEYVEELRSFFLNANVVLTEFSDFIFEIDSFSSEKQYHDGSINRADSLDWDDAEDMNLDRIKSLLSNKGPDLQLSWMMLISLESFLKRYAKSTSNSILRVPLPVESLRRGASGVGLVQGSAKDVSLKSALRSIENYSAELQVLAENLNALGISSSKLSTTAHSANSILEEVVAKLQNAQEIVQDLTKLLPDPSLLISKVASIRSEWEALSRKHSCGTVQLVALYNSMESDLSAINDLQTLLPKQMLSEGKAFSRYAESAGDLTRARVRAGESLMQRLNKLMPELDMQEKTFKLDFTSVYWPWQEKESKDFNSNSLKILANAFSSNVGWDSVTLGLVSMADNEKETQQLAPPILNDFGELAFTSPASPIHSKSNEDSIDESTGIRGILSSGECARLALALETLSSVDSDLQPVTTSEKMHGDPREILVLDEIDAHIGGDAAVAVARLLKEQGNYRQIFLVTHNPVIAAAADHHILVRKVSPSCLSPKESSEMKTKKTSSRRESNFHQSEIRILENSEEREAEIARMATGRLNTNAGLVLAKALLQANFEK